MTLNTTASDQSANSYVTDADFKAYAEQYGYNVTGFSDDLIEQACRRGTRWIDATYGNRFIGKVANSTQSLEWPRKEAVWRGELLDSATIPPPIKNAVCEAIWRELNKPNSLSPDYVQAEAVKQEQVGDISTTYKDGKGTVEDVIPIIPIIDNILSGLLIQKTSSTLFVPCVRA